MHVVIAGGGIIGLTSAYYLARSGHAVTLIEKNQQLGSGASYANGCQLSYSYVDPFANRRFLTELPRILAGRDPGVSIAFDWRWAWWRWNLKMLRQSGQAAARHSLQALIDLASHSAIETDKLFAAVSPEMPVNRKGKLVVFPDQAAMEAYQPVFEFKRSQGLGIERLTAAETAALEPAIAHWQATMGGALFAEDDHAADTHEMCIALERYCIEELGVEIIRGQAITDFKLAHNGKGRKLQSIELDQASVNADAFVLAAGVGSRQLGNRLGLSLDIEPIHGFSLTVKPSGQPLKINVTSLADRMVFAPVNGHLRVAGYAHTGRMSRKRAQRALRQLKARAASLLPNAADFATIEEDWMGARPMRPDSLPLISGTPIGNVFLNTGHGSLGWTLACGSAHLLTQIIDEQPTTIKNNSYRYH